MCGKNREFFQIIHRIGKLRLSDLFDDMTKMEFITLNQIEINSSQNESKRVKMSEIAKCTGTHFSAVSRTINGLEERGLVIRISDSEDRRSTYVELTDRGKQQLDLCQRSLNDFMEAVFAGIGENDITELKRILNRVYDVSLKELDKKCKKNNAKE